MVRFAWYCVQNLRANYLLQKAASENLHFITEFRKKALKQNRQDLMTLINATQFLLICTLDISSLCNSTIFSPFHWQRQLHVRHLALALFEFEDDMPKLLGKDFRYALGQMPDALQHLATLATLRNDLASTLHTHHRMLMELRHLSAAHREQNSELLLKTIKSADRLAVINIANGVLWWAAKTEAYFTSILLGLNEYQHEVGDDG